MGLRSGVPMAAPSLVVNRLCGSGFQAIINGAQVMGYIGKLMVINGAQPHVRVMGREGCVMNCLALKGHKTIQLISVYEIRPNSIQS